VIAAISQAIPTLAIAYSPKLRALMKRIGTPRYVLDSAAVSGNDLALLARELWNNKALVRNSIGQKLANEIIPAARRNVDILSNFREP
jgi:polysaccharide pyruvyl transferase WcaK-like protein